MQEAVERSGRGIARVGRGLAIVILLALLYLSVGWYVRGGGWHCLTPQAKLLAWAPESRDSAFATLGPEEAYHVYMCRYPPQIGLEMPFARMGAAAIPVLRRHLDGDEHGRPVAAILSVLEEMQRLGSYDVRADTGLLGSARQALSRINDPWYHEMGARAMQGIETSSRVQ
jgi:hypothetical protein